jgi:chemotaxis protein MotA
VKVIKASFAGALGLVKGARYGRAEYIQLLKLVYDILVMARKDGVLAIERHIEDPDKSDIFKKYPGVTADHHMMEFITDCLRLISGGNLDPHELESLLEYELDTHHKETAEPAHAVQKVADALPGFGIVAAVLGIVSTMAAIEGASTAEIGHKVGAALVGTFLGILVAYGFVGPIASAMEHKAHEEAKAFEVVKMALVASVRGYPPPVAVEFARKLLFSGVRPNFKDLEQELRGKKPAAG